MEGIIIIKSQWLGFVFQRISRERRALHGFKDTQEMEHLVGSEFTVRFSDVPERSVSRALCGQPTR
jgi:hypothetical protein